nr:MAG TPA: hypothetical protein [Caudoviricetes sp.]
MSDVIDELLGYIQETPVFMKREPRKIIGKDFIKHIDDTLRCGNRMPIRFPSEPEPVDIIKWRFEHSERADVYPVSFYFSIRPDQHIFIENIDDWQKDAWEGSPTVRVTTDRKVIRETLNSNGGNAAVFVSGKGLTFYASWTNSLLDFDIYVFLSGDEKQYFHSTKGTRLRTKKGGGAIEFNLDHVRRIHVD